MPRRLILHRRAIYPSRPSARWVRRPNLFEARIVYPALILLPDDCLPSPSWRSPLDARMNAMEPEQFTLADTPMTDVAEGDAGLVPADASSSPPTVPPDVVP